MTEIGFDHFYCRKAFQFIDLQVDNKYPDDTKALLIEYAMWLAYQIHPSDSEIIALEAALLDENQKPIPKHSIEDDLSFSAPCAEFLRYKF